VPEADINLHLDLQCPGEASTSSHSQGQASQSRAKTERRSSQTSNDPEDDGIVVVERTPTARVSGQRAGGAGGSAPVAPIFGGMRRNESEEKPSTPKDRGTDKRGQKRGAEAVKQESGEEKRVKANPLLANQPCVLYTHLSCRG
jgi:putative ATPase